MKIARILYPVTVLGPGKRIGIWTSGCDRRCKGCANPELWQASQDQEIDIQNLLYSIDTLRADSSRRVDGITISGGEPFSQREELLLLINEVSKWCDDILIFTGFLKEELMEDEIARQILSRIQVLVDGAYIEDKNEGEILRGSSNQRIFYQSETIMKKYDEYEELHRGKHPVENFRVNGGVIAVGIHKKDFKDELEKALKKRKIVK